MLKKIESERICFSWNADADGVREVYLTGGYHSVDKGCPDWGSNRRRETLMIGDAAGRIDIRCSDGTGYSVPLVMGYTLWFYNKWKAFRMPFEKEGKTTPLGEILKETLFLFGAYENREQCVLRLAVPGKKIVSLAVKASSAKYGYPVFLAARGDYGEGSGFFCSHTVDGSEPYPPRIRKNLYKIRRALYTYESDFKKPVIQTVSERYPKISFSGDALAEIAGNVFSANLEDILGKIDEDGFFHTSSKDAPGYDYDGFGTYLQPHAPYYTHLYSRDSGRAILTLCAMGLGERTERTMELFFRWLMYFPESGLTFGGKPVRGHWALIPNIPLNYSQNSVNWGWPTQYTRERFGDEYQNLGNQETDGHGLLLMACRSVYLSVRDKKTWLEENFRYIEEAVSFIEWQMDCPEWSLSDGDLLYSESEAGMMEHTLYCNLPNYYGLLGACEMARDFGSEALAQSWAEYAERLKKAIGSKLSEHGGQWRTDKFGYYHDPFPAMAADRCGYDLTAEEWYSVSRNTYEKDFESASKSAPQPDSQFYGNPPRAAVSKDRREDKLLRGNYFGVRAVGYDHCMLTQNALLLDRCEDYSMLFRNLVKICYAPRHPKPYIAPEGFTADIHRGIYRRQGDVGNLVQQAETLKCFQIVAGIFVKDKVLCVYPRPIGDWSQQVERYSPLAPGSEAQVSYRLEGNGDRRVLSLSVRTENIDGLRVRLGPFASDVRSATCNGEPIGFTQKGKWAYCAVNTAANGDYRFVLEI